MSIVAGLTAGFKHFGTGALQRAVSAGHEVASRLPTQVRKTFGHTGEVRPSTGDVFLPNIDLQEPHIRLSEHPVNVMPAQPVQIPGAFEFQLRRVLNNLDRRLKAQEVPSELREDCLIYKRLLEEWALPDHGATVDFDVAARRARIDNLELSLNTALPHAINEPSQFMSQINRSEIAGSRLLTIASDSLSPNSQECVVRIAPLLQDVPENLHQFCRELCLLTETTSRPRIVLSTTFDELIARKEFLAQSLQQAGVSKNIIRQLATPADQATDNIPALKAAEAMREDVHNVTSSVYARYPGLKAKSKVLTPLLREFHLVSKKGREADATLYVRDARYRFLVAEMEKLLTPQQVDAIIAMAANTTHTYFPKRIYA